MTIEAYTNYDKDRIFYIEEPYDFQILDYLSVCDDFGETPHPIETLRTVAIMFLENGKWHDMEPSTDDFVGTLDEVRDLLTEGMGLSPTEFPDKESPCAGQCDNPECV